MNTTTNIPFVVVDATELNASEQAFAEQFGSRVIGQPGAAQVALMAYNASKNPLRDRNRPIGIYYLVGQSRTGKSLTAEVLAEIFHGDRDALIRIQASDYEEDHQIMDIKGAPPSYVGYRDPKDPKHKLEEHEEDPYSVVSTHNLNRVRLGSKEKVNIVVIEEFEKSAYNFYKLWMGVFDKGTLKLGNGQTVDFTNTIFVLTSNLATDELEKMSKPGIGFRNEVKELTQADVTSTVEKAMALRFKKEFRNRLDAVVIFKPLTNGDIANIVDAELRQVTDRIYDQVPRGSVFTLEFEQSAKDFLLAKAGREVAELKRVIARELLQPLGRLLNPESRKVNGGDLVRVSHDGTSEHLTFAVASGRGGQSEAENMFPYGGDTPESAKGLSFQRRVAQAKRGATKDKQKDWSVILTTDAQDELLNESRGLLNDFEQIYEVEVTWVGYSRKSPWMFSCNVVATEEQMKLIRSQNPELTVNPIGKEVAVRK